MIDSVRKMQPAGCGILYAAVMIAVLAPALAVFSGVNEGRLPPEICTTNQAYRAFIQYSTWGLAVVLGAVSARIGMVGSSMLRGAAALAAGVVLTALAYLPFPRVHYPGIDLSPSLLWAADGLYIYVGTWLVLSLIGTALSRRAAGASA